MFPDNSVLALAKEIEEENIHCLLFPCLLLSRERLWHLQPSLPGLSVHSVPSMCAGTCFAGHHINQRLEGCPTFDTHLHCGAPAAPSFRVLRLGVPLSGKASKLPVMAAVVYIPPRTPTAAGAGQRGGPQGLPFASCACSSSH